MKTKEGTTRMPLYLKRLSAQDGQDVYDMLQDIEANDNGFHNPVNGMPYEGFLLWLKEKDGHSRGENLPEWMVPETYYWLYDGDTPVGHGRIRHYLNEMLESTGGHIGYAVAEAHRGKGYGNEILRFLLLECDIMGIKRVQIGANIDNVRSNKVILSQNGILLKTTDTKNIYIIDR